MTPLIFAPLLLLPFVNCLDAVKCAETFADSAALIIHIPLVDLGAPIIECSNDVSASSQVAQCVSNHCQCSSSDPTICRLQIQPCLLQCGFQNLPFSCLQIFYVGFWDILHIILPESNAINALSVFQGLVGAVGEFVQCINTPPSSTISTISRIPTTSTTLTTSTKSTTSTTSASTQPPTCANTNAPQICKTQGCCNYDCDNLPPGFTQSGTLGVTCPMDPTQKCCLGTNGCAYYCNTPVRPPPQGTDCFCVAAACESAITSASSATDCGANCYARCIANAVGGICTGTSEAAQGAPALIFSSQCNGQPQGSCSISFSQPDVNRCQSGTSSTTSTPNSTSSSSPTSTSRMPILITCGGTTFDISSCTHRDPICTGPFFLLDLLGLCPTPCKNISPCSQFGNCNDGTQCWGWYLE